VKVPLFPWMYRSMMGQVTLLALLFLGGLVYWVGVRPLIGTADMRSTDPLQRTASEVGERLNAFIARRRDAPAGALRPEDDPVIREVLAANPGFRWYVRVDGAGYGTDDGATYFHRMRFDYLTEVREDPRYPAVCTQASKAVDEGEGLGYVSYHGCDDAVTYYEYSGIKTPISIDASLTPYYPKWVWDSSRGYMLAGLGMLLIFMLIISGNVIMIRRITALTRSFDPKHLDRQLPQEGLPSEVVPLVQAVNEMIKKVDEAQKRREFFLSTAAHEMRTPLTVLRTRLEMLADDPVKDKLVGDVGRLTTLSNQLLKLMSISGGRKLDTLVDLAGCCRRVVSEREPLAEMRGISIEVQTPKSAIRVLGDAGLLDVALANLVDNAISFSPDGGRVLVCLDEHGAIGVLDSGPGIAPAHMATLFEPFAKFPPNRNGHGLGLAIVKAVSELHGGTVSAANPVGGGAQFILALPLVRAEG